MPKFIISADVTATVRETWTIEAESADEARRLFEDAPDGQTAEFVGQEVTGDEEGREVVSVDLAAPIPAAPSRESRMVAALRSVEDDWGELFDGDKPMNGGDCCEWICQFIESVRPILAEIDGEG